jgi:hypothetical protein
VPYLPTILLLVFALVVLVVLTLRLAGAVRRFGRVSGWLQDHLNDRSGLLRARGAALRVAVEQRGFFAARGTPRTIGSSVEQEDHRA